MTSAEKRLCDAAERRWFWGVKISTPEVSRKFEFWDRRMRSAALAVYRERRRAGEGSR